MLRQSLFAAALALGTLTAAAQPGSAASLTTETATVQHRVVVVHRTVVHHVYSYEPAAAPYTYDPYYAPAYAPAPPVVALPAAAACLALALLGGC